MKGDRTPILNQLKGIGGGMGQIPTMKQLKGIEGTLREKQVLHIDLELENSFCGTCGY